MNTKSQRKLVYMEFRLYPSPTEDICTPFVHNKLYDSYSRYFFADSSIEVISIFRKKGPPYITIVGSDEQFLIGRRRPDRLAVLKYLSDHISSIDAFRNYIERTYVIPTFPLSQEEAYAKTLIRQIINAKQAKRIFSNFVKTFGFTKGGLYSFPTREQLERVSIYEFRKIGLGFKAERLWRVIRALKKAKDVKLIEMRGIGPWSKSILNVELQKDYSYYPFWDKSGERIKKIFGIDLSKIAGKSKELAGDLYIYAASYMECMI